MAKLILILIKGFLTNTELTSLELSMQLFLKPEKVEA